VILKKIKKIKWAKSEDKILKNNFGKMSRKEIIKKLPNRTVCAISYRAKVIGCEKYSHEKRGFLTRGKNRKYNIDFNFFEKINEINSYWAGFIAADGCIKTKRREIVIGISEKDKKHLELFSIYLKYNGSLIKVPKKKSKAINGKPINSGPSVRMELYGVERLINGLKKNFNIEDRKSLILKPPVNLKIKYALCYIAGYLDGDGHIHKYKNKNNKYSVGFIGTFEVLNWIKSTLDIIAPNEEGQHKGKEAKVFTKGKYPRYLIGGKRVFKLARKINKLKLPLLKRKWGKILTS